ncbi:N-acetyl-alpha-D-glucosaminyl L-malate synthase BshA [Thalassotalea euphylliae]|uniref:N-acetyl-alpha-D-glucosaminyl L-malate synthase BshA n=1 Tax=Thalassotalea euphylliae TaxID=1655234 RepID=UPI00363EA8BA
MRIGIVCHPSVGGSGLVATELGIGLAKKGHEVHFISRARPFKLVEELGNITMHLVEGIEYPLFDDTLYTFALTAKIVEVADKHELDVVHAHYSIPHSLSAYLAQEIAKHDFPIVTTIHGTDVTIVGRDKPLYPLNQFSIEKSTLVTTVSNFQKHYVEQYFSTSHDIQVLYNFIDSDVYTPDNKCAELRKSFAEPDEKILMHISNFRPLKNTDKVLEVFAKVCQKHKAKLVLIGDGPEREARQQQAANLGIADKVIFVGAIVSVAGHVCVADCVIQPSTNESFSMVSLEAMCCGVPVVASDVDGIPEVVAHGETGYLWPLDDLEGMADSVDEIFSDSALQTKLGNAGRERALDNFATYGQVTEYEECYIRAYELHKNNK